MYLLPFSVLNVLIMMGQLTVIRYFEGDNKNVQCMLINLTFKKVNMLLLIDCFSIFGMR